MTRKAIGNHRGWSTWQRWRSFAGALSVAALVGCAAQAEGRPPECPPAAQAQASGAAAPAPEAGCPQHFAHFDADGDGRVTEQEFLAYPHAVGQPKGVFARRDRETDGALTVEEFCSAWWERAPGAGRPPAVGWGPGRVGQQGRGWGPGPGRGMGRAWGPRGGGAGMGPGGGPGMGCRNNFAAFDADSDGKVTKPEFLAKPHRRSDPEPVFDARDADKDGSLTLSEFCPGLPPQP